MQIDRQTKIGWIGTGIMGRGMALKLREAGYPMTVHNRTKSKAADLLAAGADWADSPKNVAKRSDIVFLIVGFPKDVRETILGENGILSGLKPSGVVVDMTTGSPTLAREIEAECQAKNIVSLDAPVSGGDIGARNGSLSIMIGGDRPMAEALTPLWNLLGKTVVYQGPSGSGQHAKMVNQTLIAGTMIGLCEALLYASKAGLDLEKVLKSVVGGAAGSWSLSNLGPRILQGDFAPGFMIEHFVKDLGIALEESKRMGLELPGLALAENLYRTTLSMGFARQGTQALYRAMEEMLAKPVETWKKECSAE